MTSRIPSTVHLGVTGLAAVALAALAAGCGSSGSSAAAGTATSSSTTTHAATVSTKSVAGVGTVLVDRSGRALYSPLQEQSGHVMCTGGCVAIWKPLIATGRLTAGAGVGHLGTVARPGGVRQVTVAGRPVYTFVEDKPAHVTGQGAHDAFGGRRFTWHVLTATGTKAPAQPASTSTGGKSYGY